MAKPIAVISASQLEVSESCDLRDVLQYVKRIKVPGFSHPAGVTGSAFHACCELWYRQAPGIFESGESGLTSFVDAGWRAAMSKKGTVLSPSDILKQDEFKSEVLRLLKIFYVRQVALGHLVKPLYIEKEFRIPFDSSEGLIELYGLIDRIMLIDGKAWITDYKTSSSHKKQKEVDWDHQLTFYSAAYRWLAKNSVSPIPVIEDRVELYYPKFDLFVHSYRNKEHFEDLKHRLVEVIHRRRNPNPRPRPSKDSCFFCPYKNTVHCREGR